MQQHQIDPFKLNQVLEQILDGIQLLQERQSGASPEFQILMTNYLTKANESERSQARLEEAQERLEQRIREHDSLQAEVRELRERADNYQRELKDQQKDEQLAVARLQDELAQVRRERQEVEEKLAHQYDQELRDNLADLHRQLAYYKEQLADLQDDKRKLEEKYTDRNNEHRMLEEELRELKSQVMQEQANIRNEIIDATRRSTQMEQDFQSEREHFQRTVRQLEGSVEELTNNLSLKQRELEYKDALLKQAYRSGTVSEYSSSDHPVRYQPVQLPAAQPPESPATSQSPDDPQQPLELASSAVSTTTESPEQNTEPRQNFVGGIWSKLSPTS